MMQIAKRMESITPFYVMNLLARARQLEAAGHDIIHMEIGEPNEATPSNIITAGINYLHDGYVHYTPAAGLLLLRQKIVSFYRQQYGVNVPVERIFITPGASGALLLALGVSLNKGDGILLSDPCYPCNQNFIRLFDGVVKSVPTTAETAYQLNAKLVSTYWDETTRGVLVASPSNPTGTVLARGVLRELIATVQAKQGLFFSDEIYHGLVYGEQATSAVEFSDEVFVINSFSKYFGMTGWRVGWLIVPDAYIAATEKLAQNIFISTATHSQYAALAAFDDDTLQDLELRRLNFEKKRDFLYDGLSTLGFKIALKPAGAFYIYADCSAFTDNSFDFAYELLEMEGVAVTPGKDFGHYQAHKYLRFSYTSSMFDIQNALLRLQRFLARR